MKTLIALIAGTVTLGLLISAFAIGDSDSDSDSGASIQRRWDESLLDVAPVSNSLYQEECSDCHMAYQPGLLPARSWQEMMITLDEHFDENAELDEETRQQIAQYLVDNAADQANYKRSSALMRSLSYNEVPLRISETRYFLRKHDELSRRMVKDNPDVKSFSRCEACHTEVDKGSYNEHQVRIPGFGQWED